MKKKKSLNKVLFAKKNQITPNQLTRIVGGTADSIIIADVDML